MMTHNVNLALWAFAAGAGIPVMASLNGTLGRALGSTPAAAAMLFAVGLIAASAVLLASSNLPDLGRFAAVPAQAYAGGVIVAFYIISVTYLTPRFGVANTILFVMVAQIITSSMIDHFGLLGAVQRPVGAVRITGIVILLAGLAITQLGRGSTAIQT